MSTGKHKKRPPDPEQATANQTSRAGADRKRAEGPQREAEEFASQSAAPEPREDEALKLLRDLAQASKRCVRKPPIRPRSGNRYI